MNSLWLKILAVAIMTTDHVGAMLNRLHRYGLAVAANNFHVDYMTDEYGFLRVIGRIAFPLFCFLIAEGCAHTKNLKKYIGRLALFALVSQIPYNLFNAAGDYMRGLRLEDVFRLSLSGSIFVTLAAGAAAVFFYRMLFSKGRALWLRALIAVGGIALSFYAIIFFRSMYGYIGPVIILLVYAFRAKKPEDDDAKIPGSKYHQAVLCTLVIFAYYSGDILYAAAALFTVVPLLLYNGKPGSRRGKWWFYVYYPAHLLVLALVMIVIVQ